MFNLLSLPHNTLDCYIVQVLCYLLAFLYNFVPLYFYTGQLKITVSTRHIVALLLVDQSKDLKHVVKVD